MFTHQRDFDATLEITLESIRILRMLDTINPDTNDKRYEPIHEVRQFDWNLTPAALTTYLTTLNMYCQMFKPPHSLNQEMWLDAIINRLPLAYTEHPDEILALLSEVSSSPHDFNTEHVPNGWLRHLVAISLNSCHLRPPTPWIKGSKNLMLLTRHQLGSEAKKLAKKRLDEVPYPVSAVALFDEIASSASVTKHLPDSEVRIRWKRSIEQSSFDSDYEQLGRVGDDHMATMPKELQKLLLKPIIQRQLDVGLPLKTLAANIVELSEFMTNHPQWGMAVNGLENFTAERVIHVLKNQDSRDKWLGDLLQKRIGVHAANLVEEASRKASAESNSKGGKEK